MRNREAAERFLGWIFEDSLFESDPPLYLQIFTLPSKAVWFCQSVEAAGASTNLVDNLDDEQNTYFGVGLREKIPELGPKGEQPRGLADEVVCLPALWADIDIAHKVHKKSDKLPPTEEEAFKILEGVGVAPSVVVHSGHGLQAYWILSRPLEGSPESLASVSARWGATVQAVGRDLGYTVDSVHDLARVMRLPGTMNVKRKPFVPVEIVEPRFGKEPRRYDFDEEIEILLVELDDIGKQVLPEIAPVTATGNINPLILEALCEADQKFKATWERKRSDKNFPFPKGDYTASSYDLALAGLMAHAGSSDQDIADAIYVWREKHGENVEKLWKHRTYLMRTIALARAGSQDTRAIVEAQEILEHSSNGSVSEEARQAALGKISDKLAKVQVLDVIKHGRDDPIYSAILDEDRQVTIGNIDDLLSFRKFRSAVAKVTGRVVVVSNKDWPEFSELLLQVARFIPNEEGEIYARVETWLDRFFGNSLVEAESIEARYLSVQDDSSHSWLGELFVHSPSLHRFVSTSLLERLPAATLREMLRVAGFVQKKVSVRAPEGSEYTETVSKNYWSRPLVSGDSPIQEKREGVSDEKC